MSVAAKSAAPQPGLFDYPPKAAFGRLLPKSKVYAFGKPTRRVQNLFAAEVHKIVWLFKLAPVTVNLPAGAGVAEIQIFGLELKSGVDGPSEDILRCIDKAIAFPIFFEVAALPGDCGAGVPPASENAGGTPAPQQRRIKVVAAYKRPSEADSSKCVVGDYFSTAWLPAGAMRSSLPVALNLAGLYEQMFRPLVPIPALPGESLLALAERCRSMTVKQRELQGLEAQLRREKQFNRKVEINARLRTVAAELNALTKRKTS